MRGHFVPRKAGWDCHGLPVELEVEKELGFHNEARHRALRRRRVQRAVPRVGARATSTSGTSSPSGSASGSTPTTPTSRSTNDYIESVWWSLKQVWEKGLLTEGYKVVPYCPRCGTALSSHEVALGYKDVVDPSVYVQFPLRGRARRVAARRGRRCRGRSCRTPRSRSTRRSPTCARASAARRLILAEALVERVLGEEAEIEERMPGSALLGLRYEPPFPYITDYGERGHTVLAGDFVSIEDGTGVVHTGAAFGEDDFRLGQRERADDPQPGAPGRHLRRAHRPVRRHVRARGGRPTSSRRCASRGGCFRAGEYEHSYPHCWRCDTPLIYYAKTNWYVRTTDGQGRAARGQRDDQLVPGPHQARALRQLAREQRGLGAVARALLGHAAADLALRRRAHVVCVGSLRRDRASAAASAPEDLHRPYIDEVVLHLRGLRRRDAPRARPDRRLVGLGLHAVRPVARAVRERGRVPRSASRPTTSARRSTRRAAGSTRCSRCRRCCSARRRTGRASASA